MAAAVPLVISCSLISYGGDVIGRREAALGTGDDWGVKVGLCPGRRFQGRYKGQHSAGGPKRLGCIPLKDIKQDWKGVTPEGRCIETGPAEPPARTVGSARLEFQ